MAINLNNITINRIGWKDDPDTSTPLDSGNLKEMENNAESGINELKTNVQTAFTDLLKLVFPIGSTYITQTNTNPSTILGFGTWERLKGKVCLGLDEDDNDLKTIGNTGGEKTHQHKYQVGSITSKNVVANGGVFATKNADSSIRGTSTTIATGQEINNNSELGSGTSWNYNDGYVVVSTGTTSLENNLQPYQVVGYMWIRKS